TADIRSTPFRGCWFGCANKSAEEFPLDERSDFVHRNASFGEEVACVLDVVGSRWLQVHIDKASGNKPRTVVAFFQSSSDTANPKQHALTNSLRHFAFDDDIGDSESATGAQHAKRLLQYLVLIGGKVDNAVGDDDIDRLIWQRNVFDRSLEKFNVGHAGLPLVLSGKCEHVIGHVEAVSLTRRPNPPRRQQHVDPAPGTEVKNRLAGLEVDKRGWIAAAKRGQDCFLRERIFLRVTVQVLRDRIAAAHGWIATCRCTGFRNTPRNRAILLTNHCLRIHRVSPSYLLKRMYRDCTYL